MQLPNSLNFTALQMAADNGNIEIVKLLLSLPNIDINIQNILLYFFIPFLFNRFIDITNINYL